MKKLKRIWPIEDWLWPSGHVAVMFRDDGYVALREPPPTWDRAMKDENDETILFLTAREACDALGAEPPDEDERYVE